MEHKMDNKNRLLELCSTLFSRAAQIRSLDVDDTLDDNFRTQVISAFDVMDRRAFEHQIDVTTVQHIKYAMAAFIDEVVLSSNWAGRADWMAKPLQLEFFGEHLAGENFYHRLAQLRQGGVQNTDLLEVYYVCMQLGFEGMYRMQGLEKLMALQVDLRSQIDMARGGIDPRLSSEAIPKQNMVTKVSRNVPFWVIGSVTLAFIFFIYLGFSLAMNHQADEALTQIQKHGLTLLHSEQTNLQQ